MRRKIFPWMLILIVALVYSCGSSSKDNLSENRKKRNIIKQKSDGTISLTLDNAECYSDMGNPYSNTAEWNVVVLKSGRYNVWLSSATKDTTSLNYKNSVLVSVEDSRVEATPACDKIVLNSSDVMYPYFRADSFLGSMYIQDTGQFNIQVISEKILPKDYNKNAEASEGDVSKLISVSFTPVTSFYR
ncbi:MAG: hypothetical protein MUC93_04280 [Bacteroidales bacterium]|jgi:hypothetical protein|nr:hypothetical protein [Bacteroidales bacterium]